MPLLLRPHRSSRAHLPARERLPPLSPDQHLRLAPSTGGTAHPRPLDNGDAVAFTALREGHVELVGRLTDASNSVFLMTVEGLAPDGGTYYAVHKPVAGERPLWDFPDGTLAGREVAACLVDRSGGWGLIPATVSRAWDLGPGSLQRWVGDLPPGIPDDPGAEPPQRATVTPHTLDDHVPADLHDPEDAHVVALLPRKAVPPGWLPVLTARLPDGTPVVVAHADNPRLASLAVLDAVLNNTDRKGSHVLRGRSGALWGIDHGVSLHADDKLRTILWGWDGDPLPEEDVARLESVAADLADDGPDGLPAALACYVTPAEVAALRRRVRRLLASGVFPSPSQDWHAIPWPPL